MTRTKSGQYEDPEKYNIHSATSREQCLEMGQLNNWRLVDVEPSGVDILSCRLHFLSSSRPALQQVRTTKFSPVPNPALHPMPKAKVTADSNRERAIAHD